MKLTAKELFDKLTIDYKIIGENGTISFVLKDLSVSIETKDSIGNLI